MAASVCALTRLRFVLSFVLLALFLLAWERGKTGCVDFLLMLSCLRALIKHRVAQERVLALLSFNAGGRGSGSNHRTRLETCFGEFGSRDAALARRPPYPPVETLDLVGQRH